MHKNQNIRKILLIAAMLPVFGVVACGPKVENNGYVKRDEIKNIITPGLSKNDVLEKLGSPSVQSTFGDDSWYYITDKKESYAFLKYDIIEQNVTRIDFNEQGLVARISDYNKDDSEDIAIVKRETPSEGHTLGFMEQMLGNLGRFNAPGGGSNGAVAGRKGPGGGAR